MLTREIAKTIVNEASLRVNRNINIMNNNGIIIATCDSSRLNQTHEGAVEVLKSEEPKFIYSNEDVNWIGVKPGVNLPIAFKEKIIGVIGITGDPEEINEIGELVKMMTELMINQKYIDSQYEIKQRTKDMIIEHLLKKELSYDDINRAMSKTDFPLTSPFITIVIQITERFISNQSLVERLENAIGRKHALVAFINVNRLCILLINVKEIHADNKVNAIYNVLKTCNIQFRMSYSLTFQNIEGFRQSYLDCDLALKISDRKKEIIPYAQMEARALIHQINHEITERFANRVLNNLNETHLETLESFLNHNLQIQKAADALYVHRNTLVYRLNKIAEETGLNPRRFENAVILQVAIWIRDQLNSTKNG